MTALSLGGDSRLPAMVSLLLVVLALLGLASLVTGAGYTSVADSFAWLARQPEALADANLETIMTSLRLPRTLAGLMVGGALGLAGALMQNITRNPLAEPGLLGVNAGAALGVVIGITWAGAESGQAYLIWAFLGALVGNGLILMIANKGDVGGSPVKLVLAGIAIGATCHGLTSFILLSNEVSYDQYRFWILGSLSGISTSMAVQLLPALIIGCGICAFLARPLSALMLGDDFAKALGHRPGLIRFAVTVTVTLFAGTAVALAGPIGFLGLLAPFIARSLAGASIGWQLVLSALLGALILLGADVLSRMVIRPYETPVSVMLALIGAPLLIWIVRSNRLMISSGR
ncbi:iron ABC transporter permease [Endozoicomonas sp. Mp262]|uniref:FecCD family ABC transporter permease n=1 Tax=Endozoicomonas sp. Mp262 TaxID=2919499 RepID=UPI0021D9DCDD